MIVKINPQKPEKKLIQKAAQIIKRGGLVAFPTETVYGLGANALDKKAVRKIFTVKQRPLDNPLIVHIANKKDLVGLVKEIPKEVEVLAKKFWPGPLTIIFLKKEIVPDEVTAGGKTVALRIPKNKIALELIKAAGVPVAAPSANLAGKPSSTTAQDVFEDFGDRVDLILDGGKTKIGIESTVVDVTVNPPVLLRPGGVSFSELKKILKNLKLHPLILGKKTPEEVVKSPGMKYRHYSPKAQLILVKGKSKERISKIQKLINYYQKQKKKVGVMTVLENKDFYPQADLVLSVGSQKDLEKIGQNLFKALREFDRRKIEVILTEGLKEKGMGFAIMNRLEKAASKILGT